MERSTSQPRPIREALDEVITTSRQLLFKRIDLLQLEAESTVDDVATRLFEGCIGVVLATLALVSGSIGLVLFGARYMDTDVACAALAGGYAVLSAAFFWAARRRRNRSQQRFLQ